MNGISLGKLIQEIREAKGISRNELAIMTMYTSGNIFRIETGLTETITMCHLSALKALGYDLMIKEISDER